MRLAVIASHPIQYQAPLYRELAKRLDLTVFFAHRATAADQAMAGYGVEFDWDSNLFAGFEHTFMQNTAIAPGLGHFSGCDTPEVGVRLKQGRFDAVLIQGWHLKTYLQALFAAKRQRLRTLVRGDSHLRTHRSKFRKMTKAAVYPPFLRLFDAALYVGTLSRRYWEHYSYPESRLFFSPHCVDTDWFGGKATSEARSVLRARFCIADDVKVALFAGRLVAFKRPLDLVEAAARCADVMGGIAVLVAGSGALQPEIETLARRLKVPVHFLGFCNQSEMPAVYAAADMLVLPSDANETWGLVANEALACGRPLVLSSEVGCVADFAADTTVGRAFPMADIGALADAMRDICSAPPKSAAISAMSRAYSPEKAADGIEAALMATVRRR